VAVLAALGGGAIHNRHLSSLAGTQNTRGVLEGLMGRGLVRESDNRYSLTGTFVEYLQQEWDLSDWATRIMAHFSSWVERHQAEPEYVLFEIEAILAILTWAVRAGRWQEVLHLSRGVEGILMAGKQWGAWQTVLQSGLQAAQMLGDQAAEAWALHQLGTRAMCLGDKAAARSALEQAFKIRQSIGDRVGAELTRQNQSLLSASLPAPAKPAAPAKPTKMPLRPLLLFGGAVTVLVTLGLIIFNLPTPETPPPVRESPTSTSRAVVTFTHSPKPVSTTVIPSWTPTTIFSPTNTKTFTPTTTRTFTPTRTRTFTPTNTRTITPPPSFGSPQLSTNEVYYYGSSCSPDSVTIRIFAQHPAGILAMVFFHRLHEIGGSQDSGWSSGLSMSAIGNNMYSLTVSGDRLVSGTGFSSSAQVSYQFVIQPKSGKNSNSRVYTDLYLYPCDYSPEPIYTEPPYTEPPPVTEPPIIGFPLPYYTQPPIFIIVTQPPVIK